MRCLFYFTLRPVYFMPFVGCPAPCYCVAIEAKRWRHSRFGWMHQRCMYVNAAYTELQPHAHPQSYSHVMSLTRVREWCFMRTVCRCPFLHMLLCERVSCMGPDFTASTEPAGYAADTCCHLLVTLCTPAGHAVNARCQDLSVWSWLVANGYCVFHDAFLYQFSQDYQSVLPQPKYRLV